jgi:hypothetical protein
MYPELRYRCAPNLVECMLLLAAACSLRWDAVCASAAWPLHLGGSLDAVCGDGFVGTVGSI